MEVLIDRTQVFTTDPCTVGDEYASQSVDITHFADGRAHTIQFRSETFATNGGPSSFFVDRVSILDNQPLPGQPSICAVTWRSNTYRAP
jgi:hypothetical protein